MQGSNQNGPRTGAPARVTLRTIRKMADDGRPFACLACYDATMARLLSEAGVHLLLAGDSAADVVLGLPGTIHMPLEFAIRITAAVKRGAPDKVVMADMPFMSYHASDDEGVRNAGRFMTEGLADIVKLEAGASRADLVRRMTDAGIPVCAHVGAKPQHAALKGGYGSAGRTAEEAARIVEDAVALDRAGAGMLLVEAVPEAVTRKILERTSVPLIGIGAGPACHGQILVVHDLLGLTGWQPGFAKPIVDLGEQIRRAGVEWVERVSQRKTTDHRYEMRAGEIERFLAGAAPKQTQEDAR